MLNLYNATSNARPSYPRILSEIICGTVLTACPSAAVAAPALNAQAAGSTIIVRASNGSSDEYGCSIAFDYSYTQFGEYKTSNKKEYTYVKAKAAGDVVYQMNTTWANLKLTSSLSYMCVVTTRATKPPVIEGGSSSGGRGTVKPVKTVSECVTVSANGGSPFTRTVSFTIFNQCGTCFPVKIAIRPPLEWDNNQDTHVRWVKGPFAAAGNGPSPPPSESRPTPTDYTYPEQWKDGAKKWNEAVRMTVLSDPDSAAVCKGVNNRQTSW
jgi:hypothetical protein